MTLRRTRIVCTLGPASSREARINFSHGSYAEHGATIERVRAVADRLGVPVALLQDLQGPNIRTGALADGKPVTLRDGQAFTITKQQIAGTSERVSTTYAALPQDVKPGDRILLSDGAIELRVRETQGPDVVCEVVHGGT